MANGDLFGYAYLQNLKSSRADVAGGFTAFIFLDSGRPRKPPNIEIKLGPFPTRAEARDAAVKACARVKGKGFWIRSPPAWRGKLGKK